MIELIHGNATESKHNCDLVFTNPYAPLPAHLQRKPMLICDFSERASLAEQRCGSRLVKISSWYGGKNTIWAGNTGFNSPIVDLTDLNPEPEGWFPEELVRRLLPLYAAPGATVWDGFMGRGTVGRVCRELGMNFIGIDNNIERVKMAHKYVFS